jgi:hypothetical protein
MIEYIQIERITLQEFITRVVEECRAKSIRTGKDKGLSLRKQHWIYLINHKKLKCPVTGEKVSYCSYDKRNNGKEPVSFHYNFYSESGKMFTIDHKLPISKGGSKSSYKNIQVMIDTENFIKSDNLIYM